MLAAKPKQKWLIPITSATFKSVNHHTSATLSTGLGPSSCISIETGAVPERSRRNRFNAKELDGMTGNYYYGARYYNP